MLSLDVTKEEFQHASNVLEAKINGVATKLDVLDGEINDFKEDVEEGRLNPNVHCKAFKVYQYFSENISVSCYVRIFL